MQTLRKCGVQFILNFYIFVAKENKMYDGNGTSSQGTVRGMTRQWSDLFLLDSLVKNSLLLFAEFSTVHRKSCRNRAKNILHSGKMFAIRKVIDKV